jgi:hypothetical protein
MKITFILPTAGLSGGVRFLAIYAQKLQQRGHDVFVISQPFPQISLKQKISSWLSGKLIFQPTVKQFHFCSIIPLLSLSETKYEIITTY